MDIPIEIRDLVAKAAQLENLRDTEKAEAGYLEAMRRLGDSEPVFRGMLYINLATNAQHAGQLGDAAAFFRKSIQLLEGERGEAHLHCAHAHFNLAHQLYQHDDPAASAHATEALKRYHANPYAEPVDRVDASMLSFLCGLFIEGRADEKTTRETWAEVRAIGADALNAELLENFLINWLSFSQQVDGEGFSTVQEEVRSWLPAVPESGKLAELLGTKY